MWTIINQIPSSQITKQLIQDLDGSIALHKGFVFTLRETWLLKLNSSKHTEVHTFLFKINYLLHQFTSVEFTEVINNGGSLTYRTNMDLKQSKTVT